MNTEVIPHKNGALAPANGGSPTVIQCKYFTWTAEDYTIAKEQKGKDLTDSEFQYAMKVATARGLNPLTNQIYFIRRFKKEKDQNGTWRSVPTLTIQTAIEGFILIAERTGRYDGCKTWTSGTGRELKAHAIVYKKGSRDIEVEIDWEEFKQVTEYNGTEKPTGMWAKMPKWMLQKVALARALSRAFPEDLSGLNTNDEMPEPEPNRLMVAPPPRNLEEAKAKADEMGLQESYAAQLLPPETEIQPDDQPWLFKVKRAGKEITFAEMYEKKPEWFRNIRARFEQGKMTEAEYVNAVACLENPHLRGDALETLAIAQEKAMEAAGADVKAKLQAQIAAAQAGEA